MIPKRLIRVVPEHTSVETEQFWEQAKHYHPRWTHLTLRDPIDPAFFPLTSERWKDCESGAQLADLIRAEELFHRGGVYIDSDVEVYKPFDPLIGVDGFAGYEDSKHIPNAVMGFAPAHLALRNYIHLALQRLEEGTWMSGVGTITEVFMNRTDVLLLPPGSFYPWHYSQKDIAASATNRKVILAMNPWAFAGHHWRHSWASEQ